MVNQENKKNDGHDKIKSEQAQNGKSEGQEQDKAYDRRGIMHQLDQPSIDNKVSLSTKRTIAHGVDMRPDAVQPNTQNNQIRGRGKLHRLG